MNILFVCTGNVCRSVIAEKLLKKILAEEKINGIAVRSVGIAANPQYRIYGYLAEVMTEAGIDFSDHKSTQISTEDISWADLILVMEKGHRDFLKNNFPSVISRLYLLKEYAGFGEEEIADPLNLPPPAHKLTLEEIKKCVEKIVQRIKNV